MWQNILHIYIYFPNTFTFLFSHKIKLNVDLKMPDGKRFKTTYPLYQSIDPECSNFEILTTKVELKLKKGKYKSFSY